MAILRALLVLAYPLLVYAALQRTSPRAIAIAVLALLAARALLEGRAALAGYARAWATPAFGLALVFAVTALWNDRTSLLAAPALGSFALLAAFARSLRGGRESIVEAIARVQLGVLDAHDSRYCRRVTAVWCGFFLANGLVALGLAVFGSIEAWALYTGLVSYLGIAALYAVEFVYRQWRFRRYLGAPTDFVFRRLFPPRTE
jgi:uncharacterized membrane protein